jgi:hypothetical protein
MVDATLASVSGDRRYSKSWKKLEDRHRFSKLRSAFWRDDDNNDIGPGYYVLDLGIGLKYSKMWVPDLRLL